MGSANERWRYNVTSSLIGWAHTQNDPRYVRAQHTIVFFFFLASVAAKYHVTKYPTLKLFRHGQLVKREYRGQRSVDSLANFLRDQVKDPVNHVEDLDSLEKLDVSLESSAVIMWLQNTHHRHP